MSSGTEIDLAPFFAPIYWGVVISLMLGGMTIVQAYVYFPSPGDRPTVRATAAVMLLLDLASSALIAQSIYYYLIPHFGSTAPLNSITPELSADCLISAVITAISQLYFVHQLVNVKRSGSGSWVLIGAIVFFLFIAFAGGIGCVGSMYKFRHGVLQVVDRNHFFEIFFGIAKGAGAITDILATIAMCLFLRSSKTGMRGTNGLLKSLVQFTLQRGALVTTVQALLLITFYAAPGSLAWFAFHVNVTKLYANTFFAMLNARAHLNEKHLKSTAGASSFNSSFHMSSFKRGTHVGFSTQSVTRSESPKPLEMPTVTKTVLIADV